MVDVENLIAAAEGGDWSNFAREIDGAIERGVDHVVRRNDQKRVAVRRRARHHLGRDVGGGTRPVLDDECLTEPLLQPFSHQARRDVDCLSRGKADDDAHGPAWIALRIRNRRDGQQRDSNSCQLRKSATWNHHALLCRVSRNERRRSQAQADSILGTRPISIRNRAIGAMRSGPEPRTRPSAPAPTPITSANYSPQHFHFNESTKFWQGAEEYVLENDKGSVHRVAKTRGVSGQPPRSLSRMLPPLAQNTSTTPIREPPATRPEATGKVNSSASFGFSLSSRSAMRAPKKNKSP